MRKKGNIFKLVVMLTICFLCVGINTSFADDKNKNYDFSKIDSHAINTPKSAEKSIEALSAYLTKTSKNDIEKTRAIFRWIAENVSYDMKAYTSGNYGDSSAAGVLKSRSSVCEGYSRIFKALGEACGFNIVKISGYSKGYGYSTGQKFNKTDHAWNAVKIDGKWHLFDSTWAAGSVNFNGKWKKEFNDYYFMTAPKQFIYTHLPEDQKWQLLERPVSMKEYQVMPRLKGSFFKNGLKLVSHKTNFINADSKLKVVLKGDADTVILSSLLKNGKKLSDSSSFVQKKNNNFEIKSVFPEAGVYILQLFAKNKNDKGMFQWVLDYKIKASSGESGKIGFPVTYLKFKSRGAYLIAPLNKYLASKKEHYFEIKVPGALDVAVIENSKWHHLNKNGDIFKGKVKIGNCEIGVYAKFSGQDNNYSGLLKYKGY